MSNMELYALVMLCEYQINVKFAKCSIDGRQTDEYNQLIIKRMMLQNEIERRLIHELGNVAEKPAKKTKTRTK